MAPVIKAPIRYQKAPGADELSNLVVEGKTIRHARNAAMAEWHGKVTNESQGILGGVVNATNKAQNFIFLGPMLLAKPLKWVASRKLFNGLNFQRPQLEAPAALESGATKAAAETTETAVKAAATKPTFLQKAFGEVKQFVKSSATTIGELPGIRHSRKFLGSVGTKISNSEAVQRFSRSETVNKLPGILNKTSNALSLTNEELGHLPAAMEKIGFTKAAKPVAAAGKTVGTYAKKLFGEKFHGSLKEASVSNAVFAGAGVVTQVGGMGLTFKDQMNALGAIQADLTKKPVSRWDLMTGSKNLHPAVRELRNEIFGGRAWAGKGLELGGAVANTWLMLRGGKTGMMSFMAKSLAINMGTNVAAKAVTAGNTALSSYLAMSRSFKQTGRASVDQYVGLIGGFAPKAREQAVMEAAHQAFERKLKPKEVVQLLADPEFLKSTGLAQGAKPVQGRFTAALGGKDDGRPAQGKFTGRMGDPAAAQDRQVHGQFTAREAKSPVQDIARA